MDKVATAWMTYSLSMLWGFSSKLTSSFMQL